jgi:hypothetical protein
MSGRPEPLFKDKHLLKCPTAVCDSGNIVVMGWEWGPEHRRAVVRGNRLAEGWIYLCHEDKKFAPWQFVSFYVSEEELKEWNP